MGAIAANVILYDFLFLMSTASAWEASSYKNTVVGWPSALLRGGGWRERVEMSSQSCTTVSPIAAARCGSECTVGHVR